MLESFVDIAISKATSDEERLALQPVALAAKALDAEEASFASRIAANKALRGEGPTRLTKRKQAEVDSYASDAEAMKAGQLEQFRDLPSSASIIFSLKLALDSDVDFWSKNHTKADPADVPLTRQLLEAKIACRDRMAEYLYTYASDDD